MRGARRLRDARCRAKKQKIKRRVLFPSPQRRPRRRRRQRKRERREDHATTATDEKATKTNLAIVALFQISRGNC